MLQRLASDPGVTIGLALLAGITVQVLAQRLRIPSIILLLGAGILLGPDGLSLIRPANLGASLHTIIGFGVSIILFEGAMQLELKQLRRQARVIRQLSTTAVAVTAVCSAAGASFILGWELPQSILFGTLVTVTGPTVITPLVRRMRLQSRIATILQAEGIFVDAIGAIIAVVALEVILSGEAGSIASGFLNTMIRLAIGVIFGVVAGFLMSLLLREETFIPETLQRVFVLAFVLALFQIANAAMSESGILAVIVAGMVVGNTRPRELSELREFKEQLTVLMLGLLFVLLAADVRLAELRALRWQGLALVAFVMFVVRPLNIMTGTIKTDATWRERVFLSLIAPRGIVAAAVASLFAQTLEDEHIPGGPQLRAMVFMVIALSVVFAGTLGPALARILGLRRSSLNGFVILGAHPAGRAVAAALKQAGRDVLLIDSDPQMCAAAEQEGLRVLYGSGLSDSIQQRAELDVREGCVGATTNDEVNLLFARRARQLYHVPQAWVAIRGRMNLTVDTVRGLGSRLLFGEPVRLDLWNQRIERGQTASVLWTFTGAGEVHPKHDENGGLLMLAVQRGAGIAPVDENTTVHKGDILHTIVFVEKMSAVEERLGEFGFQRTSEGGQKQSAG